MNMQQPVDLAAVQSIISLHQSLPGALLPMLHAIQEKVGYVPAEVVPMIAVALNLSRAEVHGVVSFYHFFRQHPAGAHVVQICRAEACQARGANALIAHAHSSLSCAFHETTDDGQFSLDAVYCLGQCASGPNIMLDDKLYARVGNDKFDRLLAAKRGVK